MSEFALPTVYQEFIALSRYARFDPELGRRETWNETVQRLTDFWRGRLPKLGEELFRNIQSAILNQRVMPSMRSLMTAGPAAERDEVSLYNCSAAAVTGVGPSVALWDSKLETLGFDEPITIQLRTPIVFDEFLYILLCGTGAGFSVERQFISEMPTVGKPLARSIYKKTKANFPGVPKDELSTFDRKSNTIVVADSKYGWASALRILVVELYNGNYDVKHDTSGVRKAGEILKTFGGRASGPAALIQMFEELRETFRGAHGRKLTSQECHDVMCYVAQCVVVGGVRRAALLGLSNLSDDRMRYAKSGEWWNTDIQRKLANNSVAYTEKPTMGSFMREWQALYDSKSGERGIFNRQAAKRYARLSGRDDSYEFLTNPCAEIILRPQQFCNLTSIVVRAEDTLETLMDKAEVASILGTMQATATNFVYLSPKWKENCEEERLLGVSMSGSKDHPVLQRVSEESKRWLDQLSKHVRDVNAKYAKMLGINPAAAATCNKPAGTDSQLNDTASGLHGRHSPYYFRSVRADEKDPLAVIMEQQGFPCEVDETERTNKVFTFGVKSPEGAETSDKASAIEQLEYWLMWKQHWCDSHNPSVTVYVKEEEWFEAGAWVYAHFDDICGISFLPYSDHIYKQAPYVQCTEEEYLEIQARTPKFIDLEALAALETTDQTTGLQEYACSASSCDLI